MGLRPGMFAAKRGPPKRAAPTTAPRPEPSPQPSSARTLNGSDPSPQTSPQPPARPLVEETVPLAGSDHSSPGQPLGIGHLPGAGGSSSGGGQPLGIGHLSGAGGSSSSGQPLGIGHLSGAGGSGSAKASAPPPARRDPVVSLMPSTLFDFRRDTDRFRLRTVESWQSFASSKEQGDVSGRSLVLDDKSPRASHRSIGLDLSQGSIGPQDLAPTPEGLEPTRWGAPVREPPARAFAGPALLVALAVAAEACACVAPLPGLWHRLAGGLWALALRAALC